MKLSILTKCWFEKISYTIEKQKKNTKVEKVLKENVSTKLLNPLSEFDGIVNFLDDEMEWYRSSCLV